MPILTAVDGDTVPCRVTEEGYDLAQRCDEELVLLHVMPQEKYDELYDSMDKNEGTNGGVKSRYPFQVDGPPEPSGGHSRRGQATKGSQFPLEDAEQWAEKIARRVAKETLDDISSMSFRGRVGHPVDTILSEAKRMDATYLVVGGRKRTPVGKAMFGCKTQSMLLNTDLPVLTVMRET